MGWDCLPQNCNVTYLLCVEGKHVIRLGAFHNMCNVTHFLLTIGKNVMRLPSTKLQRHILAVCWRKTHDQTRCLSQHMQCHSLPVGHRTRCDMTAFHKTCNITHMLLVIGKDMAWLQKCGMSLTCCWSWKKMWQDCISQMSLTRC